MSNLMYRPFAMEVCSINDDLRHLLGIDALPKRAGTGFDHRAFAAGWNAAIKFLRENPNPVDPGDVMPDIERVIFNGPATVVYWDDGSKTVVKCQPGDTFSAETGLMAAMLKRFMGNDNTYNKVLNFWLKEAMPVPQLPAPTE